MSRAGSQYKPCPGPSRHQASRWAATASRSASGSSKSTWTPLASSRRTRASADAAAIRHDRDAAAFRELDARRLAAHEGRAQHGGRHATRDRGSRLGVPFEGPKGARRAWGLCALGRRRSLSLASARRRLGLGPRQALLHEADGVGEGRVVAQLERLVARDAPGLADGREGLGLLHGVDAEVGLEVEVEVEHVGRVARLLGHDREHPLADRGLVRAGRRRSEGGLGRRRRRALGPRQALLHEADGVGEGRIVAQLERLVARDAPGLADGREGLGLLHGVDAEVGLEVEVEVEHVGRVARLLGHDREHPLADRRVFRGRRRQRGLGSPSRGCASGRRGLARGRRSGRRGLGYGRSRLRRQRGRLGRGSEPPVPHAKGALDHLELGAGIAARSREPRAEGVAVDEAALVAEGVGRRPMAVGRRHPAQEREADLGAEARARDAGRNGSGRRRPSRG